MNPDSGEENAGGMADRTRSRTQHLTDEEERTERLRVYVMMDQESSGGVGPGAEVAPREPLNAIPAVLSGNDSNNPAQGDVTRNDAIRDAAGNKGDASDDSGNDKQHQRISTGSYPVKRNDPPKT